jgi:tetratricopeptide (TPR) repeat protein
VAQTLLSAAARLVSPLGLGCLCAFWLSAFDLPDLPQVNTADFLPVIRTQIERAEAKARAHPRAAKATGALAMTLHAYQQYDAAALAYLRAKILEPQNFDWPYLLGAVEMAQGAFDAAIESFQSALQIRPEDLAANLRLAESLITVARWEKARALYGRVLAGHPDCARAWYGLGRVQSATGDHNGAVRSYVKGCELFPRYGAAHFALAGELRRLGKAAEAEQHLASYSKNVTVEPPLDDPLFQRIHELNQSAQAHMQRGAELGEAGNFAAAIREQEAALSTDPHNVQAHVNLISLYARSGDAAKAKQHFEAAIELNPGRSDAWYDQGVLLVQEKDFAEAEKAYRRALELNPYYAEAHNNLGVMYEQQGRLDEAAREFREAIADRPDYPLARFQLGRILVNQQKYDEAIRHFLRALEPESDQTPTYLYALGATYARAGDLRHAREYLQKAHDGAVAHGQLQLATSIEHDLKMIQNE